VLTQVADPLFSDIPMGGCVSRQIYSANKSLKHESRKTLKAERTIYCLDIAAIEQFSKRAPTKKTTTIDETPSNISININTVSPPRSYSTGLAYFARFYAYYVIITITVKRKIKLPTTRKFRCFRVVIILYGFKLIPLVEKRV